MSSPAGPSPPHPSDSANIAVLHTEEQIQKRVRELGAQIRQDYEDEEITLLCILKGSFMFAADLARAIEGKVAVEFLGVRSYGDGTRSSGAVQITHDLTTPIQDRHVLIVEDIVDTGLTLEYLKRVLTARGPASLKICALLQRPGAPTDPDYVGFRMGDGFVVGYGLDWAQRFRNLPFIGVVQPPIE